VVASPGRARREAERRAGFNPLHCGAVVASYHCRRRQRRQRTVSIPFIAGQWSLPWRRGREDNHDDEFQSPSLRGSGRFRPCPPVHLAGQLRFNPLHCGAVVASRTRTSRQSGCPLVSIPFIAGQWSLRHGWMMSYFHSWSFNPLHCGAVVASRGLRGRPPATFFVSIPFIAGQWSLPAASEAG